MCGARATPSARMASSVAVRVTSASSGTASGAPGGRQRSMRSHSRWPPAAAGDPDLAAYPHHVEHARDDAAVGPADRQPRRDAAVLDLAQRQRAVGAQAVEDVGAELLVELPPLRRARACRPRAHQVAVQRQVLAEHERRLVGPVLEQRRGPRTRAARAARGSNGPRRLKTTSRWLRATTLVGSSWRQRSERQTSRIASRSGRPRGAGPSSRCARTASRRAAVTERRNMGGRR